MFNDRKFLILPAFMASALLLSPVRASVWTDAISYDGIQDDVQDNSVSLAIFDQPIGTPGHGIVSVGDIIAGTIKWNTNTADGVSVADHSVALFAAMIIANPGVGDTVFATGDTSQHFDVGPAPGVLETLIPTVAGSVGGAFPVGTLAVILSKAGGVDPTTIPFGTGPGTATGLGGLLDTYAADLALGFATAIDYFEADVRDHLTVPAGGGAGAEASDGIISITDFDGDGYVDEWDNVAGPGVDVHVPASAGLTGMESGGFSVLADYTGPGPAAYAFLPNLKLDGSSTGSNQFLLSPTTTLIQPTPDQVADGYAFADQSLISLNATAGVIPEPLSLLVWAGLVWLASAQLGGRRRHI
jgi:hypothetical protein